MNYSDPAVQRLIEKNEGKIAIGITIDGTKEKHDLQRVFPDGSGSYDIIYRNLELWKNQFSPNTKVTFASDDLKYLKDNNLELEFSRIHFIKKDKITEELEKFKNPKREYLKSLLEIDSKEK